MDRNPPTLLRTVMANQPNEVKTDLYLILSNLQLACKIIANAVGRAGVFNLYGAEGTENSSGDAVKKLDIFSNDVFINCMKSAGNVSIMASEENDKPIFFENARNGKYAIVFDPLDGSSNIDANVTTGTIFGVYKVTNVGRPTIEDVLQQGNKLICAGYTMYSSACMLVISFGKNVQSYTLDPTIGEFILTQPDIRIPESGRIYSANESLSGKWDRAVLEWVEKKKSKKNQTLRWIGSMVGDVHRTLMYGGLFMYPSDSKNKNGKLRLVYELNPMAFLCEAAGGLATTGTERILDMKPDKIHTRRPIIVGSGKDVQEIIDLYKTYGRQNKPDDSDVKSNELTIE